tara:strand:- start:404 stop:886 length:483 start_codon:yes stop_codon:yes gene_type:complete
VAVNLLKPSSTAGAVIHSDSGIGSSGTKKFYLKVVSFALDLQNKPIDLTSETDEFPDIRHLNFMGGSFKLSGFMARDKQPALDNLRNATENNNILMRLYVGSDQQSSEKKYYWYFKTMINRISTQFVQTAPATQITMAGIITSHVANNANKYSIFEETVT